MALNTGVGTNPVALTLSLTATGATSAAFNRRIRAFTSDQRLTVWSPGAATLYGVNHPGRINSPQRVFRFKCDGSATTFTLPTAPTGVTYPTTADASITAANYLQAIALVLPEERGMEVDATLLLRKGSDATPGAGEWKINGTGITTGDTLAAGKWLEIIIPDPNAIVQHTGGNLTANTVYTIKATDFLKNGAAIANIVPANVR
jgi:hypothetical protein